jgi:NAD-dependent deacetylase sirtuin 1
LEHVVELIRTRKKIMVLTGAGISVSCGIPDFRSKNGLYSRIREIYDLPDPQALFDIHYFKYDPKPFFSFAKELWPGTYQPSKTHLFIKMLETQGKLLRNYTQNIDTLEHLAGVERVIQCHGSFATATCMQCRHQVKSETIQEQVLRGEVPYCPQCPSSDKEAVLKPDIVFFGEMLPDMFDHALVEDKNQVDLLIVIGSSLKVQPVASIIDYLPHHVPQILINREAVTHVQFDVELLGNCDAITTYLSYKLGWQEISILSDPVQYESHRYLFEGNILASCQNTSPSMISDSEENVTITSCCDTSTTCSGERDEDHQDTWMDDDSQDGCIPSDVILSSSSPTHHR